MTHLTTLRVAQDRETLLQAGGAFTWRYAYIRSADTRAVNDLGQDRLVIRCDATAFAFAVCDGVSQSFFGDLAARILADGLIDWLWESLADSRDATSIEATMAKHLDDLVGAGNEAVHSYPLADDLPPRLRNVLEQKRAIGSESTFVCGRIDRPSERFPEGCAVFAWLGDTRLRLWGPEGERTSELGDTFHSSEHWSTSRGTIGPLLVRVMPHVCVVPLLKLGRPTLVRVMAYSDGLALLDTFTEPLSDTDISALIASATESSPSDDIAFLEMSTFALEPVLVAEVSPEQARADGILQLPHPRQQVSEEPSAAPAGLQAHQVGHRLRATWQAVPGATSYQVEVGCAGVWTLQVLQRRGVTWESWSLQPGHYTLRVRAWVDDRPSHWTAPSEIHIEPRTFRETTIKVGLIALWCALLLLAGMILQKQLAGGAVPGQPTPTPPSPMPTGTATPTSTPRADAVVTVASAPLPAAVPFVGEGATREARATPASAVATRAQADAIRAQFMDISE